MSFNSITPTRVEARAHAGPLVPITSGAVPYGFHYMDMSSLIEFCRVHMQESDRQIRSSMEHLDRVTGIQQDLTNLKSIAPTEALVKERQQLEGEIDKLRQMCAGTYVENGVTFSLSDEEAARARPHIAQLERRVAELDASFGAFEAKARDVASALEATGQHDAAVAVQREAAKAMSGNRDDLDSFKKSMDAQVSSIGASREMAMVQMQALVSQRGTILQMTTNMIAALNKAAEQIAANLGH
jgi:hypothetical protein